MLSTEEVKAIIDSYYEAQAKLIKENVKTINGVPLFYGKDIRRESVIHRFPFFSLYSKPMHQFVTDVRLKPVLKLLQGYDPRIVEDEKDGPREQEGFEKPVHPVHAPKGYARPQQHREHGEREADDAGRHH